MLSKKKIKKNVYNMLAIILVLSLLTVLNNPVLGDDDDELDQYQKLWNGGIGVGSPDMLAQSFRPTDNLLTRVELNVYKTQETEYNISVSIRDNLSGSDLAIKSLSSDQISTSGQWVEFDFPDLQVEINETYYIVLIPDGPGMVYVWRGFDNTNFDNYAFGEAWLLTGGEWSNDGFLINDWAFKTYKSHFSEPPNIPEQPTGPSEGYSWTLFDYQTNSSDPNMDDISYGWDWDGDDIVDEWTEYYDSGITITTSHFFPRSGVYSVKVKAMDIFGGKSEFSDSIMVNITNDPPFQPAPPDGESITMTMQENWFVTSTIDPEGHFVKYGWDWDGDDIVDEWTAFFQSGFEVNSSHRWIQSGTYNVKVKAMDEYGAQSNFSNETRVVVVNIENDPPEKPLRPVGEMKGWKGLSYSYGSQTIDPNGDLIWYLWDWDDGSDSGWIGPFESGQSCNVSHTWDDRGYFQVKVKARDESGVESVWSDSLPISMPIGVPDVLQNIFDFLNRLLL